MAKILIIEPHPEVRELLVRVVSRLGHEAVTSESGEPVVDADLILVEPAVPGSLGLAQTARAASGAPVVCVTVGETGEAAELDPVAILVKPFSLLDLESAVVSALELREHVPAA